MQGPGLVERTGCRGRPGLSVAAH